VSHARFDLAHDARRGVILQIEDVGERTIGAVDRVRITAQLIDAPSGA
jgi:hypothetical protein